MDWLNNYESNTELYTSAIRQWPTTRGRPSGKWILASFDNESIIVYQAYKPEIATYACENGHFTGCSEYNEHRMTWIKTNFLWMMYRSRWASKSQQRQILAIQLRRAAFESYLAQAVHTDKSLRETDETTPKKKTHRGSIRIQWDPDHYPDSQPVLGRRAIQLGLKNIQSFLNGQDIIRIVDITSFVHTQYNNTVLPKHKLDLLRVPVERVYVPQDEQTRLHIRLDPWTEPEES